MFKDPETREWTSIEFKLKKIHFNLVFLGYYISVILHLKIIMVKL